MKLIRIEADISISFSYLRVLLNNITLSNKSIIIVRKSNNNHL